MFSSSTAAWRFSISAFRTSGCSIKDLSILAPMAVLVRSRTQRRDPRFCFSRSVSTSSRFLRVEVSIIINWPEV